MWPSAEEIERLQSVWLDRHVAVESPRPDLARFRGLVGRVKAVNMNGRALVEFLDFAGSQGWFDIEPACLKEVPPPEPKVEKEKPKPVRKVPPPAPSA